MTDQTATSAAPAAAAAADSLPARLIGVLFSPQATFQRIVARPRWVAALATVTLVTCALTFGMLSTERGQSAMLDQQVRQTEAFGQTVTEEQYTRMEQMLPVMRYIVTGSQLVMIPVITLVVVGILYWAVPYFGGWHVDYAGTTMLIALGAAMALMAYVLVAGSPND